MAGSLPSSSAQIRYCGFVTEPGARLEGEAGVAAPAHGCRHRGQGRCRVDADPVDQLAGAQVVQGGAVAGDDRRVRAGQVLDHVQPAHRSTGGEQHRDAGGLRGQHGRGVRAALTVPSGDRKVPSRSVAISFGVPAPILALQSGAPAWWCDPGEARTRSGWPGPDSVPDGDGEPDRARLDGDPTMPDGDPDGEPDSGDGDPDCGEGDPDCGDGELDCGRRAAGVAGGRWRRLRRLVAEDQDRDQHGQSGQQQHQQPGDQDRPPAGPVVATGPGQRPQPGQPRSYPLDPVLLVVRAGRDALRRRAWRAGPSSRIRSASAAAAGDPS